MKTTDEMLKELFADAGIEVGVQTIDVPAGKTIEEVMKEHGFSSEDGGATYITPDGKQGIAVELKKEDTSAKRVSALRGQAGAVRAMNARIDKLKTVIGMYEELRDSIATPLDERTSMHLLQEILLADRIKSMDD